MAAGAPQDGFWFHKSLSLDREEALEGIIPLTRINDRSHRYQSLSGLRAGDAVDLTVILFKLARFC